MSGLLNRRMSPATGAALALLAVGLSTGLVYPLKQVAPAVSLGVVYLPAVFAVSALLGLWPGVLTSLASALAFNFFHIPPLGRFAIGESENVVALAIFLAVAIATSSLAQLARARAEDAERRREEADLAAALARLLLAGELAEALPLAAERLAVAIGVPSAEVVLGAADPPPAPGRVAFALQAGGGRVGTLLLPGELGPDRERRVREHVVPSLNVTLAAALEREALVREVVETAALRRSDSMKTAILRAVSHDLRTPLTAILAASDALRDPGLEPSERDELGKLAYDEASRLARLIDQLLDLSKLEAGAAAPNLVPSSLEEILDAAVAEQPAADRVGLSLAPGLPALQADPVQLERAFANLIENALRHGGGEAVQVRARAVGDRLVVRVVDQGRGIPRAEQERIFEPFYRPAGAEGGKGSGLGLAIAKGFVEASGGRISVESVPGQSTAFVVQFPLGPTGEPSAPAAEPTAAG
jgi:two-component system sensor histidine kinase KdpD